MNWLELGRCDCMSAKFLPKDAKFLPNVRRSCFVCVFRLFCVCFCGLGSWFPCVCCHSFKLPMPTNIITQLIRQSTKKARIAKQRYERLQHQKLVCGAYGGVPLFLSLLYSLSSLLLLLLVPSRRTRTRHHGHRNSP